MGGGDCTQNDGDTTEFLQLLFWIKRRGSLDGGGWRWLMKRKKGRGKGREWRGEGGYQ